MIDAALITAKFQALSPRLDEATLRIWAASEARSPGRGGISTVAKTQNPARPRVRAAGGGLKKLTDKDANLVLNLDALVDPISRGDPMSPLRWTCKSTYRLAKELQRLGHKVSQRTSVICWRKRDTACNRPAWHERVPIQVCHVQSGTSKWNKIERRMFCHISTNWRGRPLVSRQVVVNLIGSTTTREGLRIKADIDESDYEKSVKVTDAELTALAIERDAFHGEWNYRLSPRDQFFQP
jgi:hypothetical protein